MAWNVALRSCICYKQAGCSIHVLLVFGSCLTHCSIHFSLQLSVLQHKSPGFTCTHAIKLNTLIRRIPFWQNAPFLEMVHEVFWDDLEANYNCTASFGRNAFLDIT